ncbi:UDP-glucose 4-epimerase GalE [Methylocystis sp. FS]|uniref:UDP-glucose 4-epimerase GalE n=1 Tax=Methylocystis silviterrae TaxID=2743612 RepID=UPI00158215B4|nr:UDP-glucose 4-epimerase GalE [Methylocystis silviterrae]NUJ81653.1 UDP-glucose 4-epimerase GalE [Methylocystis silviterrae]
MTDCRHVLVTGGAGYIGSHACKALSKAGCLPIVFDSLVYGHEWAVKWGPLERGDILDRARVDEVIAHYRPSAIMHFAAFAYVGESVTDPGKYYRNNVVGSLNLLEAARDHGVDKFVFSSTCATYGVPDRLPITEDTPQWPINPYGASKLMIERMLADFGAAHGLRSIVLRYFNAAGADPDGEIGEWHDPEPHLVPLVLDAASGRRPNVTVFGTDYDTPDGTCIRDYIHVTDLAEAHAKALSALETGSQSAVYNLGNGQGFSVLDIVNAVERVTGLTVPASRGERRAGDPAALVSDTALARDELGWQPQIASIDDIVRTAWAWHQKSRRIASPGIRTATA